MVLVVVAFPPQGKRTKSPPLSEIACFEGVRVPFAWSVTGATASRALLGESGLPCGACRTQR